MLARVFFQFLFNPATAAQPWGVGFRGHELGAGEIQIALAGKYECCETVTVRLTPYSQATYETNRYSLPVNRARREVILKAYPFHVDIYAQAELIELSQGGYLSQVENIILIGNPGLGKSHIATGLALAACRQGKRVRFFGVASLVNDPLAANHELRLSKLTAQITKLEFVGESYRFRQRVQMEEHIASSQVR